jgi:hypothetical protein
MTTIPFNERSAFDSFSERFHDEYVSIAASPDSGPDSDSGSQACEVLFPRGSHYGADLSYEIGGADEQPPESMYASYWLYLDDTFRPATDGKLPGFAGRYANTDREGGWGSRVTDGTNGWSARGAFAPADADGEISIGNYVYHVGMGSYGSHAWWDTTLETGRWYKIDQYIELNTPGRNDGVLQGWVNQNRVYESDDWRWRDTESISIREFWCNFYHGNDDPAPQDMTLYMDGLHIEDGSSGP